MNPNLLLAFWGVAFVLIAVPGPDWAYVLAAGARDRIVLPAVSGLMIGYATLTAVVAAGVGAVVADSAALLTVLTAVGAGYLIYLGVALLRHPGALHVAGDVTTSRHVLRGVAVSGLNPKGVLIFLAVLPQFTDAQGRWPVPVQLAALGLVFVLTCGVFYTVVGLGARMVLNPNLGASRAISRASAVAMVVLGCVLMAQRIGQIAG